MDSRTSLLLPFLLSSQDFALGCISVVSYFFLMEQKEPRAGGQLEPFQFQLYNYAQG